MANRIYNRFGAESLDVIKNTPDRLYEIDNMTPDKINILRDGVEHTSLEIWLVTHCPTLTPRERRVIVERYEAAVVSILKENPYRLLYDSNLSAPTGKAVLKLESNISEKSVINKAQMIDRYIVTVYDKLRPSFMVIDEMSMVDLMKMKAFSRLLTECQILFVGDVDQLPSIGRGQILKDLLSISEIPRIKLEKSFRIAHKGGSIIENANAIMNQMSCNHLKQDDAFEIIHTSIDSHLAMSVISEYANALSNRGGSKKDIAVLCPMEKGQAGVHYLNYLLQTTFNKNGEEISGLCYHVDKNKVIPFRIGDRVMQTVNHSDMVWMTDTRVGTGVYNGDVGVIIQAPTARDTTQNLIVLMDDCRRVIYNDPLYWDELTLAYAMTIHKSQGSEYLEVIVAASEDLSRYGNFANRNLLYTAITRAKERVCMIGDMNSFNHMIVTPSPNRKTGLAVRYYRDYDLFYLDSTCDYDESEELFETEEEDL